MQFYILGGQTLKLQLEKKKKKATQAKGFVVVVVVVCFCCFFFFEILFGVVMSPYRNTLITEKGKSI